MKTNVPKESKIEKIKRKAREKMYYNTCIQIIDNSRVIVENCKHIVECNEIMVKLLSADFEIEIWGNNLTISDYNTENIIVNGQITNVELSKKSRGNK